MRQSKGDIKLRLKGLPKEKCISFAVRSAMRVLPLLAKRREAGQDAFWYWGKDDKSKHLLALYRAYSFAIECSSYAGSKINMGFGPAFATSAAFSGDDDATTAIFAIRAAAYIRVFDLAANAADAVDAADAVAYSAYAAAVVDADAIFTSDASWSASALVAAEGNVILEMHLDLLQLEELSAMELLNKPLWSDLNPAVLQQLYIDFKRDALSLNAGFEPWIDWYEDRLKGVPIDLELLKAWNSIPAEIVDQGAEKFNAYLRALGQKKLSRPLNRVRAIFIGYGEAGKTSLIRALHDELVVEGQEDMTAGIAIRDWPVPNTEIKAHFWDFGGQVMAHATHQFFLRERCLYVLVLNARSEINSNEQAEYWLEHVKSFGNCAPVMIVGNKTELAPVNLDMGYLKEKYPNIIGFYPLSCTQAQAVYKTEFESFKRDFCEQLNRVDMYKMMFDPRQFAVLEELIELSAKDNFLPKTEFDAICERHHVTDEGELDRKWLLDILDKLGVVIYFKQMPFLDEYVLNPRWLTHGVYTLMYERKAKLTEADALDILRKKPVDDETGRRLDYPVDKCRFILDAMQEFKLCYPVVQAAKTFIIPELLPSTRPEKLKFEKKDALAFEFAFTGFLPRHIMPELIVTRHAEIVDEIVWQNGVLFKHQCSHAHALLEVSYHDRIINIWVNGADAKDYLAILNDEILKILNRLTDLKYDELVELPVSACITGCVSDIKEKAKYRQLLNSARNGIYTFSGERNVYDLKRVFGIILPESELPKYGMNMITQNIYNSTIYGSVVAAEKLKNSFNNLKESESSDEVQRLLGQLLHEIEALNAKVPSSQTAETQALEKMAARAESLVNESKNKTPDKELRQFSLKGITDAAIALKELGEPVLKIIEMIGPLI